MSGTTRSYDVVVIGGGIVGAATAYYLGRYGAKTALVERGSFGTEASGRNAGTLNLINDRTVRFDGLKLRVAAIERWRGLSEELGFDLEVNLGKGTLLVAEQESEFQRLRDLQAGHQGQGLTIEWFEGADLRAFAPYLAHHVPAAIYCPIGGLANPRQAGWAYAQAAAAHGTTLLPQTEATAIRRITGGGYAVDTAGGEMRAGSIVLAAGPWSLPLAQAMGFELPLRIRYFQAAATTRRPAFLLHGLRRVAGMLTLKQVGSGNCVLGGGWTGNSAFPAHGTVSTDALAANCAVAAKLVPAFAELSILRSWAGYDGSSLDGEPILDQAPGWPGVYVSTGASAGFSYGPLMGEMARRKPPWAYQPRGMSKVLPYHGLKRWPRSFSRNMLSPAPASMTVTLDGVAVTAYPGESVAGLLARLGHRATRRTFRGKAPRGYFCGMGACFECIVQIDGRDVQGCLTYVAPGMEIVTGMDASQ